MRPEIKKQRIEDMLRRWRRKIKQEGGEYEWQRTIAELKPMQRKWQHATERKDITQQ